MALPTKHDTSVIRITDRGAQLFQCATRGHTIFAEQQPIDRDSFIGDSTQNEGPVGD